MTFFNAFSLRSQKGLELSTVVVNSTDVYCSVLVNSTDVYCSLNNGVGDLILSHLIACYGKIWR